VNALVHGVYITQNMRELLTSPLLKTKRLALHYREIQEVRDSLEGFRAAVEAGEVTGFKAGGMRAADVASRCLWHIAQF
jgi:hypothetical protein